MRALSISLSIVSMLASHSVIAACPDIKPAPRTINDTAENYSKSPGFSLNEEGILQFDYGAHHGGLGKWVFPGDGAKTAYLSHIAINRTVHAIGYKGRMTGHGSRHTASTLLREHGWPRDYVETQLAHKEKGVAGVYNKAMYLPQRAVMMQWYADYIEALEAGMTPEMREALEARVVRF